MIIAETRSFAVGRFTIWQRPRLDNPAWPQYLIYLAERLVGKSFSVPDEECCTRMARYGDEFAADDAPPAKRRKLRGICRERAHSKG